MTPNIFPDLETARARPARSPGWLPTALTGIDLIALSLWLGGLLIIGAVVAPTAFHTIRSAPELAGNTAAQNTLAGGVVGGSLRVFNVISLVCGLWLVAKSLVLSRFAISSRSRAIVASGAAWALVITLYQMFSLFPAMDSAQAAGHMARFDTLHHFYEHLSQLQLVFLLWFAGCYAWALNVNKVRL